jgi:hypothetical protein
MLPVAHTGQIAAGGAAAPIASPGQGEENPTERANSNDRLEACPSNFYISIQRTRHPERRLRE